MKKFQTLQDLAACVGQEVAVSDWIEVTQQQVNQFADATGDHQWIHVDVEKSQGRARSAGRSPMVSDAVAAAPASSRSSFEVVESRMGVNYGLNRVRFMSPVPVGSRLRARMKLLAAEPIDNNGLQMTWETTIELEGVSKPACVAESVVRRYP